MKKHFIPLAVGLTAALSTVAAAPANALSSPIYGDVNRDWQVNIADIVSLQQYLLGRTSLDENQIFYSDMNKDGVLDVFDYILLRQKIETPEKIITKNMTTSAPIIRDIFYNKTEDKEAVIRSVDMLKEYFEPKENREYNTGEMIYVASDEVIEDFLERYDDEFFRNNVLLLNYLSAYPMWDFNYIEYDGSSIIISYQDNTPQDLMWCNPLPTIIAEVAVPLDYFPDDCEVIWKNDTELKPTLDTSLVSSYTPEGIIYAGSVLDPVVFESYDVFDEFAHKMFCNGSALTLTSRYNEEFFEKNVIAVDMLMETDELYINSEVSRDRYGQITLTQKSQKAYNGSHEELMHVDIISIPRDGYNGLGVNSVSTWKKPVSAEMYVSERCDILPGCDTYPLPYETDGWVDSEEKLSYVMKAFGYTEFPEIDLDKQALYVRTTSYLEGAEFDLLAANVIDDKLVLNIGESSPLADIGTFYIQIFVMDKEYSEMEVSENFLRYNEGFPYTSDETVFAEFKISESESIPILITLYNSFGKEYVDVYRLHYGGGPVQYYGYELIDSFVTKMHVHPFHYTAELSYTENEDGSITCTSDKFTLKLSEINEDELQLDISYPTFDYTPTGEHIFTFKK